MPLITHVTYTLRCDTCNIFFHQPLPGPNRHPPYETHFLNLTDALAAAQQDGWTAALSSFLCPLCRAPKLPSPSEI